MLAPLTSMRMSYQRPVSMRPGTSLPVTPPHLDGVAGVAPAADVPPGLGVFVLHAEEDEEALGAAELAGLEGVGVVGPGLVAGDGADVLGAAVLAEGAVLDLPVAAAQSFQPSVPLAKSAAKSVWPPRVTLMSLNSAWVSQVPTPMAPPRRAGVDVGRFHRQRAARTSPRFSANIFWT